MTKKRTLAALLMSLMVVTVLSTGVAVNAAEHAFTIYAGTESRNDKGPEFRNTGDVYNPWKVRLQITTDTQDLITTFGLRRYDNSQIVSGTINVKHGTDYNTKQPFSSANYQSVILTAKDNSTSNHPTYWIAGQWAPNN